jgi:5-methylcytosine-specific restriction enzyme subunit McrC
MKINYSISEYGHIGYGDNYQANSSFASIKIDETQFKELEEFHKNSSDFFEYVNSSTLKSKGNYVGLVQTKNLTLEILPKVYTSSSDDQKSREVFLNMLLKIHDIPQAKDGTNADVDTKEMNIFEVFIALFVNHMDMLIQKGIKSDYITVEDNLNYLKGKIQFSNHIRYNLAHKERFYVEFDEYMEDRVENRVLKTCIDFLLDKSIDYNNQSRLRQQLFFFDEVSYSTNIQYDLSCMQNIHRGMEHYEMPLKFAEIFLNNQSFTPIRGTNHAFSLLFQMNIIFERYVTKLLEKCKDVKNLVISMKGKYNLLQSENKNKVWIEPDYLINDKNIVGDAKWKLIEKDDGDIKISPNDVYQVHSYLHYFGSNIGYIFTPRLSLDTDEKQKIDKYTFQTYNDSSKKLYIYYVGLEENSTIELKSI